MKTNCLLLLVLAAGCSGDQDANVAAATGTGAASESAGAAAATKTPGVDPAAAGAATSVSGGPDVAKSKPYSRTATEKAPITPGKERIATKSAPKPFERTTGGPSVAFDELSHDFGKIYEGDKIRHTFTFANAGDEPLVISRVKTSCGCTIARTPEEPIEPGERGEIEVVFGSKKKFGELKKDVSVFSNDPNRPMMKLRIEVNIVRQFWIDPPRVHLGTLTKTQKIDDKTIKVRWTEDVDINVTEIKTSDPSISVERTPFQDATSKGVELTLKFGTVDKLLGETTGPMPRIAQVVTITTDNPKHKAEKIPISGTIIPEVTLRPRVLSFGVLSKKAKPITKKLIITAAKDFDLLPPTVDSDLDFLEFLVKQIRPNKQYQVSATLDPTRAPEGQLRKSINVRTNSEEFGKNTIPVFGKIKP